MASKRVPPVVYVSPLDWFPPWQTVDQWRAARLSTGEQPTYHTPAREAAEDEWGRRAGLVKVELPHERQERETE